jgi:hypothetical protein
MSRLSNAHSTAPYKAAIAVSLLATTSVAYSGDCDRPGTDTPKAVQCLEQKIANLQKMLDEKTASIPKGAVVPFHVLECPQGWSIYTQAQGRFIRGIDKTETKIDPDGERAPGNIQIDTFAEHTHTRPYDV